MQKAIRLTTRGKACQGVRKGKIFDTYNIFVKQRKRGGTGETNRVESYKINEI